MDSNELLEPFVRMLADIAPPSAVRAVEQGASAAAMWDQFHDSGFADALVDEAAGGAGLSFADVGALVSAMGAAALPLPAAETMVARALLARAGIDAPRGPIAFATAAAPVQTVPCGLVADHVLVDTGEYLALAGAGDLSPQPTGVEASLAARVTVPQVVDGPRLARPEGGLRAIAAVLRAALISGAAERVLDMATAHANERVQFGKPIGRQQALQQSLAVMAEDMVAVRIAAQLGAASGFPPSVLAAATAKATASAAAPRIAATAHAVFGAIGISAEHDLQLFTRRLHEWRLADGSESYWQRELGAARMASAAGTVDWAREALFA